MEKAVVRGISLPRELNEALKEQARREQRPVSTVIQRALRRYLAAEGALFLSEVSTIEDKTASTEAETGLA